MTRRGRLNVVVLIGLLGAITAVVIFVLSGESPSGAAARFMVALGEGKVDKLMEMSYYSGDRDELRTQWEYATGVAGEYYRFTFQIVGEVRSGPNEAAVRMRVWRNALSAMTYDELFQLPMVKREGRWLVDVKAISRKLYPALPR